MTGYARTAIRRLSIRGFRSIRSLELTDIPDLVVLHGPNGAGKSNVLLAAQLVLRAASRPQVLPVGRDAAHRMELRSADALLGLRPEDFHRPGLPEIRIAIDVALGTKAAEIVRAPAGLPIGQLSMELVAWLPADDEIQYWFERVAIDGVDLLERSRTGAEMLLDVRIRETLFRRLLRVSPAYRVPGGPNDPEEAIFSACLSADQLERDSVRRLGRRLAGAGLFGAGAEPVALFPVDDKRYGERRILLTHPTVGDLPLRNLGSGEQQIVYMLAQGVITPSPIAQIEEPEAHLHTSLMEPFARVLHESVTGDLGTPDVDQLWIATHHRHFALALEYFDVRLVDGATKVEPLPRAKAARHFYEPGPIWEALRQLAQSAKERDAVVFRDAQGAPVTAAQILASIEQDPEQQLAMEYVRAMTDAMVLAMRKRAEAPR
jgi:energy-coupling factor transporter ATP-binding protein EcfA2